MLGVRQWGADVVLTSAEFRSAMRRMSNQGWTPTTISAEDHILSLASIEFGEMDDSPRLRSSRYGRPTDDIAGEVFFTDEDVYFVMIGGNAFRESAFDVYEGLEPETAGLPPLIIGIVAPSDDVTEGRLNTFAEALVKSSAAVMDGRRFRHLEFSWSPVATGSNRLENLVKRLSDQGAEPSFKAPEVEEVELQAANSLASPAVRQQLVELASAGGFAREQDMLAKRGKKEAEVRGIIGDLKETALVGTEYLVQCRATSAPLTRLQDQATLQDGTVAGLRCANCDRTYADELCVQGFRLSSLGKRMLDGSHWMTVWITELLIRLGVPREDIAWNLSESSEEIDILVQIAGQLWIFELKDRDFGPGDAYPFSYRRGRYAADQSIVLTTGIITKDAKRVLGELNRENRPRGRRSAGKLVTIEGLDKAEATMRSSLEEAGLRRAMDLLSPVARVTDLQLSRLVSQRYG